MHELATIQAVCHQLEELARKHHSNKVIRVVLEVSDLPHLLQDHLEETFLTFRTSSPVLRETELEFRHSPELAGDDIYVRDVELEVDPENESK